MRPLPGGACRAMPAPPRGLRAGRAMVAGGGWLAGRDEEAHHAPRWTGRQSSGGPAGARPSGWGRPARSCPAPLLAPRGGAAAAVMPCASPVSHLRQAEASCTEAVRTTSRAQTGACNDMVASAAIASTARGCFASTCAIITCSGGGRPGGRRRESLWILWAQPRVHVAFIFLRAYSIFLPTKTSTQVYLQPPVCQCVQVGIVHHNLAPIMLRYGVITTCGCSGAVGHGRKRGSCIVLTCSRCVANFVFCAER